MVLLIPLSFTAGALNNLSSGWPWLLGIGLCQGVGVLVLVAFAMRKLSSLEFGIVSCLEPLEAALIGFFVYSEVIMAGQWCGFALVLSAILAKSVLTRSTSVEPAAKPALDDDYEEEYNESLT